MERDVRERFDAMTERERQRDIRFYLRMDRAEQRMEKAEQRMEKFDRRLEAMRKLVELGMKLMIRMERRQGTLSWKRWRNAKMRPTPVSTL
jgi:hypothetical protein